MEETKKCKYCQSDIPKKATVCPVCKRKQSSTLKVVLICLAVFLRLELLALYQMIPLTVHRVLPQRKSRAHLHPRKKLLCNKKK